jgi:hypothetical protein
MMDSMMGGVMGIAWVLVLLALGLVIGGLVFALRPRAPAAGAASASDTILTALAIIGGIALVAVLAIGTTHLGMRCCG